MPLRKQVPYLLLFAPLVLAGCLPETPDYIDEYDLVYTDRSPSYDFQAANTYAIPDSVIKLSGDLAEGETPEGIDDLYGDRILERVRQNMSAKGWTEVGEADHPDVIILPMATTTVNVDVYNYYMGYWGWYYPGYAPGWGWYYPGYYPVTTSYTTGSLVLQMTDPNNLSPTDNLPVVWLAVVNGLFEGSTNSLLQRVDENVDQMFTQSPYLKQ